MVVSTLAQGWSGLAFSFAAMQAPLLVGLAHGRAALHKYAVSPVIAGPLAAAVGLGMASLGPLIGGIDPSEQGLVRSVLSGLTSAAIGYAAGRFMSRGSSPSGNYQRGALVDEQVERSSYRRGARWHGRAHEFQITLAGQPVPARDESKHFKFIGTTGTGKSTAIQEILRGALLRGDRVIVADPDAGYLRTFYDPQRGDVVLNPFDSRSKKWDLFAEINDSYDVEQLARSLIPDGEGSDRSWRAYARTFFGEVTRQAHEAGVADVGELHRLLLVAESTELRTLLRGTSAQPFLEEHNSRMFDSIRSVTGSAVGSLSHIARQNAPAFSVRGWVANERRGALFMPYKAGQIAALAPAIAAWMRLAIFATMDQEAQLPGQSRGEENRLWFVIDELDALGPIDGLKDALARLRKFGGRCILGMQSIAQVSSTYGSGDAHTIVENCGNTLIFRSSASEGGGTARFASQLIGEREVLRTTVSRTRRIGELGASISHSRHPNVEQAVLPSQLEQLPDLEGYLKLASDGRWRRVRLDPAKERERNRPSALTPSNRSALRAVEHSHHSGEARQADTVMSRD